MTESPALVENPDARPEPIVVDTFEGEFVRVMRGKLPAITLEMVEGFPRGTHVKFVVEARVRNVRYEEALGKEHKGELVRDHVFVIEEVALADTMTAEQADAGVGGSASAGMREIDDMSYESRDCYYDASELALIHRGGCDLCYRRVPANQDALKELTPDPGF